MLVGVCLGMRESQEDWLGLARDLIARGLPAPMLVVADGAPGLTGAVEQCWPASDRQHCSVHRARNLIAKLPEAERERVRRAYWQALDEAKHERDAKQRLEALVSELERAGFTSAARCLADDLDALVVHLRYPTRHRRRWRSTDESVKGRTPICWSFSGDRSVAVVPRRAGDRLLWARFPLEGAGIGRFRGQSPVVGPATRLTLVLSSALGCAQGVVDPERRAGCGAMSPAAQLAP